MKVYRAPVPPGVCGECSLTLDPLRREEVIGSRHATGQKSLFTCPLCHLPTPGSRLPPAVSHHRGRSYSTDPHQTTGLVLFYNPISEHLTITSWQTPFLEGASLTVTRRELFRLLGIRE